MDDNSTMPLGEHKGEKMANVPDNYLMWFWGENVHTYRNEPLALDSDDFEVMQYIEDSFNV